MQKSSNVFVLVTIFVFAKLREDNEMSTFLSGFDYVCSVLPSTPETNGILSGNVLQACQRKVNLNF
jgi:phosphoglycerate dehydrogenase-like enzyme